MTGWYLGARGVSSLLEATLGGHQEKRGKEGGKLKLGALAQEQDFQ